ncbi:sigma 54-interacting transcriptional regulator [Metallumcola ferriviriculae]|uniref:Sigma 54-interacting transcriptional regulator n=1 Tax=Metallumcola ferriviriculae TaxID=3039180 RepID=A0AAU0UM70_9FIRM|nr:sigma 54-interacting transcriptional regulator [Desulfitibacteraceae bacterium MK1]
MIDNFFGNRGLEFIDAITIMDNNGKILYSLRNNPLFNEDSSKRDFESIIGKHILEVFPTFSPEKSTVINCIKERKAIYTERQSFKDWKGKYMVCNNLVLPIIKKGRVLGAVEISKDVTKIQENFTSNRDNIKKTNKKSGGFTAKFALDDIITCNEDMLDNIERVKKIANNSSSVLVYGETGTGKELYAQSIHNYSNRSKQPFVAQNCAALPEALFEFILFGSVKGGFTGAEDKPGLFELANGGTLFLDEINSMPINLQAKLLRVLQEGTVLRIGDHRDRKVDVRIIAAMNIDPLAAVAKRQLREDLFYRLNVVSIKLIPLKKRKNDIPLYIKYFIDKYNKKMNKHLTGVSTEVKNLFEKYDWPGNVRELQHVIESSINYVDRGIIETKDLPIYFNEVINKESPSKIKHKLPNIRIGNPESLDNIMSNLERKVIIDALETSLGNITNAAKILKITRQRLHYKLKKYGIDADNLRN